jgi:hypothetical protein
MLPRAARSARPQSPATRAANRRLAASLLAVCGVGAVYPFYYVNRMNDWSTADGSEPKPRILATPISTVTVLPPHIRNAKLDKSDDDDV